MNLRQIKNCPHVRNSSSGSTGSSAESSPTTTTTAGGPVPACTTQSLEAALKSGSAALNIQTMQLEWLARTGMLYQRFPELAGRS